MATLIEVNKLQRKFTLGTETVHALAGIDAVINTGDFIAVMGPSGSGKSTLLYLLGGLDRPSSGSIRINGMDITGLDDNALTMYRMHQVGFVFQAFHLIPTMTALENVMFPMIFGSIPSAEREHRASVLLSRVGLGDRLHHKPTELSGGQQQRVAIARALANDPPLILADEPTGNLDSATGTQIMDLLAELNHADQRTILVVSHDPSVTDYSSRVFMLKDGHLTEDIRKQPTTLFGKPQ